MNRRALIVGLIYCACAIALKLYLLITGYTVTSKFWFFYANVIFALLMIPFLWLSVKLVRDKDYGGVISGRNAARMGLTVLAVSIVLLSVYNYIEVSSGRYTTLATQYYKSSEYLDALKKMQAKYPDKIKTESFPEIINEQINSLSPFKATTGKIFPMMLIGLSGTFIISILMRKKPTANLN